MVTVSFPLFSYTPKKKCNYSYKHITGLMALTQIAVLTHYFKYIDAGCTHGSWDPYLILGKLRYKKVHRHRKAGVFGQILHLLQSIKI